MPSLRARPLIWLPLLSLGCFNDPFDSDEPLTRSAPHGSDASLPDVDDTDDLCPPDPPQLGARCLSEMGERNRCHYKANECTIDGMLYESSVEYICFRGNWYPGETTGRCQDDEDAGPSQESPDAAAPPRDTAAPSPDVGSPAVPDALAPPPATPGPDAAAIPDVAEGQDAAAPGLGLDAPDAGGADAGAVSSDGPTAPGDASLGNAVSGA